MKNKKTAPLKKVVIYYPSECQLMQQGHDIADLWSVIRTLEKQVNKLTERINQKEKK